MLDGDLQRADRSKKLSYAMFACEMGLPCLFVHAHKHNISNCTFKSQKVLFLYPLGNGCIVATSKLYMAACYFYNNYMTSVKRLFL
jgi:hypothetical protein